MQEQIGYQSDMELTFVTFEIAWGTTQKTTPGKLVRRAIERGALTPQSCCVCGSDHYVVAHHEDYSKPNVIAWLCKRCHVKRHRELGWGYVSREGSQKKRLARGKVRCRRCNGDAVHGTDLCRTHYRRWTEQHAVF